MYSLKSKVMTAPRYICPSLCSGNSALISPPFIGEDQRALYWVLSLESDARNMKLKLRSWRWAKWALSWHESSECQPYQVGKIYSKSICILFKHKQNCISAVLYRLSSSRSVGGKHTTQQHLPIHHLRTRASHMVFIILLQVSGGNHNQHQLILLYTKIWTRVCVLFREFSILQKEILNDKDYSLSEHW